MPKKISLKSALSSQQARLKKNARAQESAQKQEKISKAKGKSKANSTRRSVIPFHAQDKILLIGEGNFSFTLALLKHPTLQYLPPENVTATAYDSEDECMQKYPDARANINELRGKGIEVLFNVDATALEKYKPLKGRRFDRVVWNFPHAGKGIADQDRNILANQKLLLGFFQSAAPFLSQGSIPTFAARRRRIKADDSESEAERKTEDENMSEDEQDISEVLPTKTSHSRGTVLITLRNVHPYTEWNLPKLAKNPPGSSSLLRKTNVQYIQLRSFAFTRTDWDGYEHRMTKGERAHGTGKTGQGGEDRTWEFCLKAP